MKDDLISLTPVERLLLKNQYAILEFLSRAHPETATVAHVTYHDPDYYRHAQRVLEAGFESLVDEIVRDGVYRVDLSPQEQAGVLDILVMYDMLQVSFDQLLEKKDLTPDDVDFPGWDGNSMKGELSFAKLFCYRESDPYDKDAKPDRFESVRPSPAYNGHGDWLDNYYRMLQTYRPIKKMMLEGTRNVLTYDEIRNLVDAFPHPDSERGRAIRAAKGV